MELTWQEDRRAAWSEFDRISQTPNSNLWEIDEWSLTPCPLTRFLLIRHLHFSCSGEVISNGDTGSFKFSTRHLTCLPWSSTLGRYVRTDVETLPSWEICKTKFTNENPSSKSWCRRMFQMETYRFDRRLHSLITNEPGGYGRWSWSCWLTGDIGLAERCQHVLSAVNRNGQWRH